MAGPRGDNPSSNYSGPKRNSSDAIFEIKWGMLHESHRTLETMTRARMAATRSCVYYVSNADAGKWHAIECLATMLYECFVLQVTTIGDANKMAHQRHGQQFKFSYCMRALFLVGQNWADNGCVHEYCSRTCFEGCEIWEPSTLPPMCVWSFWRNSLLRRLMWKRTSERKLLTLVIAALTFYEFGNVHVQRAEYRPLPWFLCVWESRHFKYWKTDGPPFFLTNDGLFFFFFFEIHILIRIALFWWSGFSPLIFSTKRRRVSRVMLEEGTGRQEEGRSEGEESKGKG